MKILWITKTASFAGGAERYVADASKLMEARGARNWLLYDPDHRIDQDFASLFSGVFPRVESARQIASIAPDVLYIHQIPGVRATRELADSEVPAVRFFHDHAPFCLRGHKYTGFASRTCTRTLGAHCIVPCFGALNRSRGLPPVRIRTLASARRELAENRRFRAFAVGSVYMKDHVVAHGFAPAAVRVLPMFTSQGDSPGKDGDPAPSLGIPGARDPGRLLFVGALLRGKGLDILLRALALLPGTVRLSVAGSGAQETLFRTMAGRLGIPDRVDFLGRIPHAALATHYRSAACVVVPSREPETFGLIGLEAFRHGTPVVAARVGGIGDWLVEGRTGSGFEPGDAGDLAAVIARTLADPDRAAATAAAGADLLSTRFTRERHADALAELLEAAVSDREVAP